MKVACRKKPLLGWRKKEEKSFNNREDKRGRIGGNGVGLWEILSGYILKFT